MATAPYASRAGSLAVAAFFGLSLLAVFFGLASALLPAWFIFAVLLVPAVAAMLLVRPEYALLACMALVCGLIHPAFVPRLPLFGGALAAADATLAMLALYAAWTLATQPRLAKAAPPAGTRLMAVALGLFGLAFAVSVFTSLTVRGLNPTFVLGETRDLLYLLLLPVAVVILRQVARQERFVKGLVVLGCLFSVGQVLQGVFNIPVFGDQGISVLETLGRQDYGTTRAVTLGIGVIVLALLLAVGLYILGTIRKPLFFAVSALLLVGIALTFGRTTYAVAALCILMVVSWLNLSKLPQIVGLFVLLGGIGSLTVGFFKPDSLAAVYYRMTSIGAEVEYGYSAQGRYWEAEAMVPQILSHPLTGLGLGADYITRKGSSASSGLDRYVHNAYLYMAGKMGIPALVFFLAALGAIFAIGRRSAKGDGPASSRAIGAAGAAMVVFYLLASITEPHFMSDYSLVVIASVGALVYLSARRSTS